MNLWTAKDIAEATGGTLFGAAETSVQGVSIDTRTITPGDLFIALRGPNHDAHDFAPKAVEAGACVVLVERALPDLSATQVLVPDTTKALEALGVARRAEISGFVLGITGSVGKTGTKELAAAGFAALGKTHATQGNLNNHYGVPLTLARMPRETEFAVIEMGMSAPGEIRELTKQVQPDAALITWISAAHSAFFENTEQIARAKAEIFEGLSRGGVAVIPQDNHYGALLADLAKDADVRRFGYGAGADVRVAFTGLSGAGFGYDVDDMPLELALAGEQWGGSAAALLAALPEGADRTAFLAAMSHVQPLKGRGKRSEIPALGGGTATLIDESYNASPAAVEAALKLLVATPTQGRRIAVLGDMLELDDPEIEHESIGTIIAKMPIDCVHVSGSFGEHTLKTVNSDQRGLSAMEPDSLYTKLAPLVHAGDIWLVKGSLGSKVHKIVDKLVL